MNKERIDRLSTLYGVDRNIIIKCIDVTMAIHSDVSDDDIYECVSRPGSAIPDLPVEMLDEEIFLRLPVKEYVEICKLNKTYYQRCRTVSFWERYLNRLPGSKTDRSTSTTTRPSLLLHLDALKEIITIDIDLFMKMYEYTKEKFGIEYRRPEGFEDGLQRKLNQIRIGDLTRFFVRIKAIIISMKICRPLDDLRMGYVSDIENDLIEGYKLLSDIGHNLQIPATGKTYYKESNVFLKCIKTHEDLLSALPVLLKQKNIQHADTIATIMAKFDIRSASRRDPAAYIRKILPVDVLKNRYKGDEDITDEAFYEDIMEKYTALL